MDRRRLRESPLPTPITGSSDAAALALPARADRRLDVNVIYTTAAGTLAALKLAAQLSAELGARLNVLRLYAVPYTLPLEGLAVPAGLLEEQLRALTRASPLEFSARIYLCRDPRAILRQVLAPHSLVVIGGKKRWWPTQEQRWAGMLRKDGHEAIFVPSE